jgi:hypothetical protein
MKRLIILLVAGSLFLLNAPSASAQLVNGGFETGDFTGWTQSGNTTFTSVVNNASLAHSGNDYASFGPTGSLGFITQTVATTPGGNYTLSFWLWNTASANNNTPNEFQVLWQGAVVLDLINVAPSNDYVNTVMSLTATGATADLAFGFRHDPSFFFFDDVTLSASGVPEPATWTLMGMSGAVVVSGTVWWKRLRARRGVRGWRPPAKA